MRRGWLGLALLAAGAHATAQDLSSQRDYSDNAQRDRPIACKPGDIQHFEGQSLGQVFGRDWPAQPAASSPDARTSARVLHYGPMHWPRGLDPQDSISVVAVLVAADGAPLRAEVVCASRMGFDKAVRRHAMASTYAPARVDGEAIVSPLVRVVKFVAVEPRSRGVPAR